MPSVKTDSYLWEDDRTGALDIDYGPKDNEYDRIVNLDEYALMEYHFVDYDVTRVTYSNGFVHFYNESNINLYIYKDAKGRGHGITVGRFDGELDVDVVNRSHSEIIDRLLWSPTTFTAEELEQF